MEIYYRYAEKEKSHETLFEIAERFYGIENPSSRLAFTESGKPFFKGGVKFNISHGKGLIAIAFSDEEVGIDLEKIAEDKPEYDKIARKYFTERERAGIFNARDFLALWTKKESAIKYIGSSIAKSLSSTYFDGDAPKGNEKYEGAKTATFFMGDFVCSVTAKAVDYRLIDYFSINNK